jgi:hypothetical protein
MMSMARAFRRSFAMIPVPNIGISLSAAFTPAPHRVRLSNMNATISAALGAQAGRGGGMTDGWRRATRRHLKDQIRWRPRGFSTPSRSTG